MLNVPHNGDVPPSQVFSQRFSQTERVQQGLGGMLVGAVARIDNGHIHLRRQKLMGTWVRMPHHHHVHLHRQDVVHGVHQGLSLFHTRACCRKIDHVCREALLCQFKGQPGPGGIFEEQVGHSEVAQRWHLLDGAVQHVFELFGRRVDQIHVCLGQPFDPQKVGGRQSLHLAHDGFSFNKMTRSSPPSSLQNTLTCWAPMLSTYFPT